MNYLLFIYFILAYSLIGSLYYSLTKEKREYSIFASVAVITAWPLMLIGDFAEFVDRKTK